LPPPSRLTTPGPPALEELTPPPGAMSLILQLLPKSLKSKSDDASKITAFLATFVWVNTWLFFPFMTFGALWYNFGIISACAFWGGLGFLVPSLSQRDSMRHFISSMRFWVDGSEIIGGPPNDGGKPMLHCHHPHGAVAVNGCSKGGLDLSIRAAVAPLCFRMPLCRQMMEAMGAVSSDKKLFAKYMKTGKDIAIIPGGVEEVVLSQEAREILYLKKRKGFVKYALEMGYDLLPVYHLGETQLYHVLWPQTEEWAVRLRLALAQRLQLASGLGFGTWWMPNLPRMNQKCITVYGTRLELPQIESPTAEDVDKYHGLYMEALEALYNSHRDRLPEYRGKPLEIW